MVNCYEDNIRKLMNYYKKKGKITLVGLNDSQLVNVTNPWGRGSFDLLVDDFKKEGINTTSLNVGSSFYNKAEHGRIVIENNLNAKEVALLNSFSYLVAYSKVMKDIGLPFGLPKTFEKIFRTAFDMKHINDITIGELLNDHPIVVTSFMANNIMRAVANNPFSIKRDYLNRYKNENFDYTLSKTKDPKVLEDIIETTKRTYEVVMENTNGQVYGLGFFLPNGLANNEGLKIFEEFINKCNYEYCNLCKQFGVSYVDIASLGVTTGNYDFHASPKEIKNAILGVVAQNIGKDSNNYVNKNVHSINGLRGVISDVNSMYDDAKLDFESNNTDSVIKKTLFEREKELMIAKEAHKVYCKKYKK